MIWKAVILFVFATLTSCESNGIAPRADECRKIGAQCSADRKEILLCTELGKPGKVVKNCENEGGKRCSDEEGAVKCVDAPKDDDKPVKFWCSAAGEYPDPLNCQHTYKCVAGKEYPTERCYCDKKGFVYPDMSSGLPCFGLGECPREEIECEEGKQGEFIVNGEGTGVCYFCTGKDTSTSFKCGNDTSRLRGLHVEKICVKLEQPPTTKPTEPPSTKPTESPSTKPTEPPSTKPTEPPSTKPTEPPSTKPTEPPSTKPTEPPSTKPTEPPSTKPTEPPSTKPTEPPSTKPTEPPSTKPTEPPSTKPTEPPSTKPTEPPATKPTEPPSTKPTEPPTPKPEEKPKCKKPGEFYPTECDCDFYECNKDLVPMRRTCRHGMLYHPIVKKCIYGDCDPKKCIYRSLDVF